MRIGVCSDIGRLEKLETLGFDYVEWNASKIESLSREEFKNAKAFVDSASIKCEACNVFFPGSMKVVGPEANKGVISEYVKRVLEKVSLLGTEIVVVGSGGPRNVPEGWNREDGIRQFADILYIIGQEAVQYNITAVLEPLNTSETNIINSVAEGLSLVKDISHPNVKLLADMYHMSRESENAENIVQAGALIKHTHIANSTGRVYPMNKGEDMYVDFFAALKKIGYNSRMSIEARTNNFDADAPVSLKLLRELAL